MIADMRHVGELASAYLDGETTLEESSRLIAHLEGCQACQREMDDLHSARSLLRSLPILEMPESLSIDLGLIQDVIPLRRRPVTWIGGAAAAVAVFVVTATALTPAPVGITLNDVSTGYERQVLVEGGLSPMVGLVTAGGGE